MIRSALSVLALLSAGAAVATAHAAPRVGILPVSGPPELARRLDRAPGPGIAASAEVARRISSAPDVKRSFLAVRAAVEQAEQDTLYMRRPEALRAVQRAVDSLDTVAGRHHAPVLAARVRVAQALALLLSPADEERALTAFRLALRADPTYRPDPDRLPSRAAGLLRRARVSVPEPEPPAREELTTLASLAGVDELVWIGLQPSSGRVKLALLLFDSRRRQVVLRERMTCAPEELHRTVARRLARHRSPPPAVAAASRPTEAPPSATGGTPWYRRWWVWAVAGAVVVGAGVTAAVVATVPGDRSYEFRFSY